MSTELVHVRPAVEDVDRIVYAEPAAPRCADTRGSPGSVGWNANALGAEPAHGCGVGPELTRHAHLDAAAIECRRRAEVEVVNLERQRCARCRELEADIVRQLKVSAARRPA